MNDVLIVWKIVLFLSGDPLAVQELHIGTYPTKQVCEQAATHIVRNTNLEFECVDVLRRGV